MNPLLLRGMSVIPGLASRFGGSAAGLTLRQAAPAAGNLLNRGMTAAQLAGGGMLGALGTALSLGGDTAQKPQWGAIPPKDRRGESYRDAELRLGNRGGSGGNAGYSVAPTPGQQGSYSPAAERAYQQEASRVAQLTAQDPELQRYERARAGAKTQEEMNAARDIGMQIWAQKHGGLAAKVKPGQSGYDAIQGTLNAGAMGQPTEMGAFAGAQPTSLLFNPSNPLATAAPTGPVDYTTVAPSAFTGATGLGAESSYFGGAANQQQAKMFTRFQDAAPGGTPLQTGMNALLAPGSVPAPMVSYQGAQGLSPVGTSLTPDANTYASSLASDKAQAQAEEFKKKLLSAQAK